MVDVELDYHIAESIVALLERGESSISRQECLEALKYGLKIADDSTKDEENELDSWDDDDYDFYDESEDF